MAMMHPPDEGAKISSVVEFRRVESPRTPRLSDLTPLQIEQLLRLLAMTDALAKSLEDGDKLAHTCPVARHILGK